MLVLRLTFIYDGAPISPLLFLDHNQNDVVDVGMLVSKIDFRLDIHARVPNLPPRAAGATRDRRAVPCVVPKCKAKYCQIANVAQKPFHNTRATFVIGL